MKKMLVIFLALMLLATAAMAEGTEWREGLGPEKPYIGSPAVNLEENIGYMLMMPLNGTVAAPGTETLQIFMPREDVQLGEGTVSLYTRENGLISKVDTTEMSIRPMTEEEKEDLIWGSGVVVEIPVEALKRDLHYYVKMTEGCIVDLNGKVKSSVIEESSLWAFSTEADNYVEDVTYTRVVDEKETTVKPEEVQVGDTVKVSIVLGEEGSAAAVHCAAGVIYADATYFTESCEAVIRFGEAGEVKWGVVFLDAEGNTAYTVNYTTVVSEKAE